MAFPTITAQQETNRKILEDLQLKKQLLQKGASPVSSIPNFNNSSPGMPQFVSSSQIQSTDSPINASIRSAWNQANVHSFGYFMPQDSVFGNSILPVLPRPDNIQK